MDSKYIFDYGISKDIFIKYINNNEIFPKPIYSVFYTQDFSGHLAVKDMGENFDLGLFLIASNTNKTISHFSSIKTKEIDITLLCNDFLDNIKSNSKKNSLHDLIDKKHSPFFNGKDELTEENEAILSNNHTYICKKTFHDMVSGVVLEVGKAAKKEISDTYQIPVKYLTEDSLTAKEVVNVNTVNNNFTIIKFYDHQPIIKTDFEILDNVIIQNNNLLLVLTKLNFEFFVSLCFDENNKKFPELKKVKKIVKGADGTLNIFKLATVVEENRRLLSKYIDE